MHVELINTGSELMLGRVLNTHQQWLCRKLADAGYVVARQVAVPDTGAEIQQAVRESLSRSDLIITTGGLGPTSDDLTRDYIAQLVGKPLREHAPLVDHIQQFFASRNRRMPERTRVQAMVPQDALVLSNPYGTAPGLVIELTPNSFRAGGKSSWIVMLPGPPRELRPMFVDSVLPLLNRIHPLKEDYVCRTLRSVGVGESMVEEKIAGPVAPLVESGLELGYCARPGQVDVRVAAHGAQAKALVEKAVEVITGLIGPSLYGEEDEELETALVEKLTARKETLALAESCTGGLIAHRVTNVPGASAVLLSGFVTYSNSAKENALGVSGKTIAEFGAVSEPVARAMAEGARSKAGATHALAVTGIAGPSGGTAAKPVGTVFIALASPKETVCVRNFNPYDRETFKYVTANQALDLLRRRL